MTVVSYAQNNEDIVLNRVFGGQQIGFYIDVGAYHPVEGSVTKLFYDRGWSGINVEPGSVFDVLAAERPRDVNLRMAVLDRKGEAPFLENAADRGMSHVIDQEGVDHRVPCDTLEAVAATYAMGRPIDFVKIDVEGAEAAIVQSTDWRRLRPRVLVIEATRPWSNVLTNQVWEPDLLSGGYVRAYFDGINCFYVPEEEWPILERHFQAPVNVLDSVVTHAHATAQAELAAAQGRLATAEADLAALQGRLAAIQERLASTEAEVAAGQGKLARVEAELAAGQGKLASAEAEVSALREERERERRTAGALRQELAAVRAEADRQQSPTQPLPPAVQPSGAADRAASAGWSLRRFARRLARFFYGFVRPIVRPIAWRMRGFLTGPTLAEIAALHDRLRRIDERTSAIQLGAEAPAALEHLARSVSELRLQGSADLKELAKSVEAVALTLAMEPPHRSWSFDLEPEVPDPALVPVILRLPGGRQAEIRVVATDLSVGAVLLETDGDWEPHVRRYFESVVKPDWVCMDIGANLGAHTLSLAVLAREGRVLAFEADPANYAVLARNVAALPPPKARIEPVQVALWDKSGSLTVGGAEELAGCCFVAPDQVDAVGTEDRLRNVVDPAAIAGAELHMRLAQVPAVRLDDWVRDRGLARLDLIKLDVEGSEANVLRGAEDTIRRLRPTLLVEYNPACAKSYFGQSPDALYRDLAELFGAIHIVEPDGGLTEVPDWPVLEQRLVTGKGWEDLVCWPAGPTRCASTVEEMAEA